MAETQRPSPAHQPMSPDTHQGREWTMVIGKAQKTENTHHLAAISTV
jgi:hypothetical protein